MRYIQIKVILTSFKEIKCIMLMGLYSIKQDEKML